MLDINLVPLRDPRQIHFFIPRNQFAKIRFELFQLPGRQLDLMLQQQRMKFGLYRIQ
ncbi:hypothetical protein D1872_332330 [compost metagenome]